MSAGGATLAAITAAIEELEALQRHDGEAPSTARVLDVLRAEAATLSRAVAGAATVLVHVEPGADVDVRSFGSDGARQYVAYLSGGVRLYWRDLDDIEAFAHAFVSFVVRERSDAADAALDVHALDMRLALRHLAAELARSDDRYRALSLLESLSVTGSTAHRPAYRLAADALAAEIERQGRELPARLREPTAEELVARERAREAIRCYESEPPMVAEKGVA